VKNIYIAAFNKLGLVYEGFTPGTNKDQENPMKKEKAPIPIVQEGYSNTSKNRSSLP
jgi:hypothetical protein